MLATIIQTVAPAPVIHASACYLAGAIIALFLLAYLVFSLIKPDKF